MGGWSAGTTVSAALTASSQWIGQSSGADSHVTTGALDGEGWMEGEGVGDAQPPRNPMDMANPSIRLMFQAYQA
jgi:hypothetical protein